MRQRHRAGEKLLIDYCGPTVPVIDHGEVLAAHVFVAVLGVSNYTYAEATWSQSLGDWIARGRERRRYPHGARARPRLRRGLPPSVEQCLIRQNLWAWPLGVAYVVVSVKVPPYANLALHVL